MKSFHTEILAFHLLAGMLISGCAPVTSIPQSSPTTTLTPRSSYTPPIATATETQASFGVTLPPSQPDYLDEVYMMDATSGWAWTVHQTQRYFSHTSNGGWTWVGAKLQDYISSSSRPYIAYPLDARTAWVILTDDSLVLTSDGGQTWEIINPRLQDELVWPGHDWYILRFADAKHGWLETGYSAAGAHEFYYETQDGGVTWNPMDFESWPAELGIPRDYKNELAFWTAGIDAIYYDSKRFIIAPGEQEGTLRMFLSTNRGHSWKNVQLPLSVPLAQSFNLYDRKISDPFFFDAQNGALTVTILDRTTNTTQLSVYGTSDGGLTWTLTGGPSIIKDIHSATSFLSPRGAVLVCGSKLCRTNDGGRTWLAHDFGTSPPIDTGDTYSLLNFINLTTGWLLFKANMHQGVGMTSRLLKTTDGGLTWTELAPTINP